MNVEQLRVDVEEDLTWRIDELRRLRNSLGGRALDDSGRRTLVVMHYAHLEGFTKHALGTYASALNAESATGEDFSPEIVASALIPTINKLRVGNPANTVLTKVEFRRLERARLETTIVVDLRQQIKDPIQLDVDEVTALESNLSADLLKRVLYRLGIPPSELKDKHYQAVEFVRNVRNDVAHGNSAAPSEPLFEKHVDAARDLMRSIPVLLQKACRNGWYRS